MALLNQKIKMKWSGSIRNYYESILDQHAKQKYEWTRQGNEFLVDVHDLPYYSNKKVKVACDYCLKEITKSLVSYHRGREVFEKDSCISCSGLKRNEHYGIIVEPYSSSVSDDNEIKENGYSKDKLINEFYRYLKEFGSYPKLIDMNRTKGYPGASGYNKHWGNWSNFLNELKILGNDGWYIKDEETLQRMYSNPRISIADINSKLTIKRSVYEVTNKAKKMNLEQRNLLIKRIYDKTKNPVDLLLEALTDLRGDVGKCPCALDFDQYVKLNKLPSRRTLEIKSGKTFGEICKELFVENNREIKSNETLLGELTALKNKLGRTPLGSELKLHGLSETKTYTRRFNMTYQKLVESLGWDIYSAKMNHKTKDEMLQDYRGLYEELGRRPTNLEINNFVNMASYQTYYYNFPSFEAIEDLLEIPRSVNQEISSGNVFLNNKNEICRSVPEFIISNILIDNNIEYENETMYSKAFPEVKKLWRMDWFIPKHEIIVEYFGLYYEKSLNKNNRTGKYSRKVLEKIKACQTNNIKLISIFPEDLDNNFYGMLKKFKDFNINLNITTLTKISV